MQNNVAPCIGSEFIYFLHLCEMDTLIKNDKIVALLDVVCSLVNRTSHFYVFFFKESTPLKVCNLR